jgi:hypothetical protein
MTESDTNKSGKRTTLGSIFISVLTVAGVALSGLINTPAKGIALVVTGLAVAAVVARFLTIWNGHIDRQLVALLVVFLLPLGWLITLIIPSSNANQSTLGDGERAQLQARIDDLERRNAALREQINSSSPTTSDSSNVSTTIGQRATTTTRSGGTSEYSLSLRYEWGADLDIGKSVRPQDAEGSDIYNDGTITGNNTLLTAFSHRPSPDECRTAIRQENGDSYYDFSEVTEGTYFCLRTDKERMAILRLTRIGHDATSDRDYAEFGVTLLS